MQFCSDQPSEGKRSRAPETHPPGGCTPEGRFDTLVQSLRDYAPWKLQRPVDDKIKRHLLRLRQEVLVYSLLSSDVVWLPIVLVIFTIPPIDAPKLVGNGIRRSELSINPCILGATPVSRAWATSFLRFTIVGLPDVGMVKSLPHVSLVLKFEMPSAVASSPTYSRAASSERW